MAFEDTKQEHVDEKGSSVEVVAASDSSLFEDAAVTAGAPVEKISPLGYHVDAVSVIFLVSRAVTCRFHGLLITRT
jgi:hypothetical protein